MKLTGIKPKEYRELLKDWVSRGAVVEMTGGSHIRIRFPNGKHIVTSYTASDRRVLQHIRSDARKYADWE